MFSSVSGGPYKECDCLPATDIPTPTNVAVDEDDPLEEIPFAALRLGEVLGADEVTLEEEL